ncbi:hypothetical protein BCR36DRAFT_215520, partial [Piromyces finnis]
LIKNEENTENLNACTPYINYKNLPLIGYGKLCSENKVSSNDDLNEQCKDLIDTCTQDNAINWLYRDIDKAINCIQECTLCKKAYNTCSIERQSILISLAHSMGCEDFKNLEIFNDIINKNWENIDLKSLNSNWSEKNYNRAIKHLYVLRKNDCCNEICKSYQWGNNDNNSLCINDIIN